MADRDAGPVLPLSCEGVVLRRGGRQLLGPLDLAVDGGGISVVLGENGAGKSLLLRVLANLVAPDEGRVRWAGHRPDRARAPRIGFVFQRPVMLRRSVRDNVAFGLEAARLDRVQRDRRTADALAVASLDALAHTAARVLSGGEQQRVALARALVAEPQALLLDEPTSSLDPGATAAIESLVERARDGGTKVVLVTHELRQARRIADEIIFVHAGRVAERTPATRFFREPVSAPARDFVAGRIER